LGRRLQEPQKQRFHALLDLIVVAFLIAHRGEDSMPKKTETHPVEGGDTYVRTDGEMAEIFIRPPDDHPVYTRIGRIAAEWSHLEHVLDEIIWLLCPSAEPRHLGCVTGRLLGHGPRYDVIIALLTQRGAEEKTIKRVVGLKNSAYAAAEARNRIVHDAWYVAPEGSIAQFRSMPPKDLRFGLTEYSDNEHFEQSLKTTRKCYEEAVKFWNEIFREYVTRSLLERLP
jgi:hypothetical protein